MIQNESIRSNYIILDTTYVLPLFGVKIDLHDKFIDEIKELYLNNLKNYSIIIPSVCLIEVMYKLNREFRSTKNQEIFKRYSNVLPSITKHDSITIFNPYLDQLSSNYALMLRQKGHSDLMDCLIASTAWRFESTLISEDSTLKRLILSLEPKYQVKIINWDEFSNMIM